MTARPKTHDVVVAGYVCADLVPGFDANQPPTAAADFFVPGKLIEVNGLAVFPGGVVANTGLALHQFGKRVQLNGLIGDDFMGQVVRERLATFGLAGGLSTTADAGTAFGIVISPPGIDRIFLESPGCSKLAGPELVDFAAVAQSRLFHFGYPPLLKQFFQGDGQRLVNLFRRVRALGVLTSLDFSLPDPGGEAAQVNWPLVLERLLPHTDIFVPSLEEMLQVLRPALYAEIKARPGRPDVVDAVPAEIVWEMGRQLINWGVSIVMIKAGHRGAYLLTGEVTRLAKRTGLGLSVAEWAQAQYWCPAFPADALRAKNTSGCGDTAAAAFLAALLDAERPERALQYAALAGRNNLYRSSSTEPLAGWTDMTREISNHPVAVTPPAAPEVYRH